MRNLLLAIAITLMVTTTAIAGDIMKHGTRIIKVGDSRYDLLSLFGEPKYNDTIGNLNTIGVGDVAVIKYVYEIGMWRYEITIIGATVRGIKKIRLRRVR